MTLCPITRATRPSTWFLWHAHVIRPGRRVIDLACGEGRHSLAAAALGAEVTAVDRDPAKLAVARARADDARLSVDWREADLEGPWPEFGSFDAVLVFNYLDRASMPRILGLVAPGGRRPTPSRESARYAPLPEGRLRGQRNFANVRLVEVSCGNP